MVKYLYHITSLYKLIYNYTLITKFCKVDYTIISHIYLDFQVVCLVFYETIYLKIIEIFLLFLNSLGLSLKLVIYHKIKIYIFIISKFSYFIVYVLNLTIEAIALKNSLLQSSSSLWSYINL